MYENYSIDDKIGINDDSTHAKLRWVRSLTVHDGKL